MSLGEGWKGEDEMMHDDIDNILSETRKRAQLKKHRHVKQCNHYNLYSDDLHKTIQRENYLNGLNCNYCEMSCKAFTTKTNYKLREVTT